MNRPAGLGQIALAGVAAGFLSGLFGVGGGILIVPALVLLVGLDQRLAHGTSLGAVLPIALSGVVGYTVEDSVDWSAAAGLTVGAMVGAVVGTHALHVLSPRTLGYAFAAVMLVSAARLVFDQSGATGRDDLDVVMIVGLVAVGFVSGALAGLLGVGGGVIMIPAMIILFGIPAAIAKGTSLAVIIPTSVVGTRQNARRGNVDLRIATVVGLAGMASAFAASKISVGLDEQVSNGLFAVLLTVVALRMLRTLRKDMPSPGIG